MAELKVCQIEGCEKQVRARGFCGGHYQRWERGKPLITTLKVIDPSRPCSVEGCSRKYDAKGFCSNHYKSIITIPKNRTKSCSFSQCKRKRSHLDAYCSRHVPSRASSLVAKSSKKALLQRVYYKFTQSAQGKRDMNQGIKHVRAIGKKLPDRKEFYEWGLKNPVLDNLFKVWVRSGFDRKLTPVCMRCVPWASFEIANLRWFSASNASSYLGYMGFSGRYPHI